MTELLVILDGASEPVRQRRIRRDGERREHRHDEPTSLERATTPVLDALAQAGVLRRLQTTPPGLPAGSETGCAVLLGWVPPGPVDRSALEAAAHHVAVPAGAVARRVDVFIAGDRRGDRAAVDAAVTALRGAAATGPATVAPLDPFAATAQVHRLGGHRLLLVGAPAAVADALRAAGASPSLAGVTLRPWAGGAVPPVQLTARTVVIGAPGAVTGLATLLGAAVVMPAGATGRPDEPLAPFVAAAAGAIAGGAERIVVHLGGADEAAHELDQDAKVAFLSRADDEVLGPLAALALQASARLTVAIDHGCDPHTGRHDGSPTPLLTWEASLAGAEEPVDDGELTADDLPGLATPKRRATRDAESGRRMTERWALPLPVEPPAAWQD